MTAARARELFDGKWSLDPDSGCWIWQAARLPKGYGAFVSKSHPLSGRAHRAAWELYVGPIPAGLWVLHRCDNPPCVNPAHLFLGTASDNTADMMAKGRGKPGGLTWRRGEDSATSKISEATAMAILRSADTAIVAARTFGVSAALVDAIRNRRVWKHLVATDLPRHRLYERQRLIIAAVAAGLTTLQALSQYLSNPGSIRSSLTTLRDAGYLADSSGEWSLTEKSRDLLARSSLEFTPKWSAV